MKKLKYITPACIVVEMETEELLALSQGDPGGPEVGQKPGVGDDNVDMDAVGGNPGGYDVWDD